MNFKRGKFIVVDGLDGIGKGVVERALIEYEQKLGKAVFDSIAFSKAESKGLPELIDFWNPPIRHYHIIITAEPTYAGIGKAIREEIIARNGRSYSADAEIELYSRDREVQMKRVIIPALEKGINVIQSRSCASTLTYQLLRAQEEKRDFEEIKQKILTQEGNKLQLEYTPDLLIIPIIHDVNEVIKRLEQRKSSRKDDKSIFDNIVFQGKLKPYYESDWLRKIFEECGAKVVYLDAGISEEETRRQAIEIYRNFLEDRSEIQLS